MRTISSQTYTNVSLTVLILLLAALVIRPLVSIPAAQARDLNAVDSSDDTSKPATVNPDASAIRECAVALQQIATAINRSADNQAKMAEALHSLGQPAGAGK